MLCLIVNLDLASNFTLFYCYYSLFSFSQVFSIHQVRSFYQLFFNHQSNTVKVYAHLWGFFLFWGNSIRTLWEYLHINKKSTFLWVFISMHLHEEIKGIIFLTKVKINLTTNEFLYWSFILFGLLLLWYIRNKVLLILLFLVDRF